MNCAKCNTPNLPEARFCKNCGTNIISPEEKSKTDHHTIKALLIIIGIDYLLSVIMFIIQKLVQPYISGDDSFERIDLIYKTYGWGSDIILLAAMLFFMATIKNNMVKTALMIFIILRIIFMIGYRVFPLFT